MTVVLDASALLALLLDERGADVVRAALGDAAMSAVNLSEVVAHFARNGVAGPEVRAILDPLPVAVHPLDATLAYDTGLLLPVTKMAGLSFGDRACLALARSLGARALGARALTADRVWATIADRVGVDVVLIR